LEARAEALLQNYLEAHAGAFERAARLHEKAERLDTAGIPSESARNRAERAHEEAAAGLAALRASFAETTGTEGTRAFDGAMERRFPKS
jgi:hypothetical protein